MPIAPITLPGLPPMAPVVLAPLAGITDLPFRQLVAGFGAGWVVSEMVASQEMVQANPSTRDRAELGYDQTNTAVQIAGRDAYWMAEAAKLVAGNGAKIIDINMGCPAKKVTNGYSGSALLQDPDHALSLITAVVNAVDVPVTLKTRLGWDDSLLNAAHVAARAEQAGVRLVTIHGRTRQQFYKGQANWAAINDVVRAVTIPVIANGDIIGTTAANTALTASGAAGVMIGRGAQGAPWLPAQIMHALSLTTPPDIPQGAALVDMVRGHYDAMLSFYGTQLGLRTARKHLGWYMDAAQTPRPLRHQILTADTPGTVHTLLPSALAPDHKVAA